MRQQIISLGLAFLLINSNAVYAQYNVSSFNYCSSLCGLGTLYVTGLELEGRRLSASTVALEWKTRSEVNSYYFELERSIGDSAGFVVVGSLPAAGNSSVTLRYKLNDLNNFQGVSYYRVKETGQDNRFLYSNTVAVKGMNTNATIMIFPNPGRDHEAVANIGGFKNGEAIILTVTDMAGRLVGTKHVLYNNGQLLQVNSICHLAPGSYILTAAGKTGRGGCRFIIVN